jgi:hypothetical protein
MSGFYLKPLNFLSVGPSAMVPAGGSDICPYEMTPQAMRAPPPPFFSGASE